MSERANPFGDLNDFKPRAPAPKPPLVEQVEKVAAEHGFPSREPAKGNIVKREPRRRYRTGRNQQINIKASAETIDRLIKIADRSHMPFGAVLELALEALERQNDARQ